MNRWALLASVSLFAALSSAAAADPEEKEIKPWLGRWVAEEGAKDSRIGEVNIMVDKEKGPRLLVSGTKPPPGGAKYSELDLPLRFCREGDKPPTRAFAISGGRFRKWYITAQLDGDKLVIEQYVVTDRDEPITAVGQFQRFVLKRA